MSRAKRGNAGEGYGFLFHGAFNKKSDAVKKEQTTPGAFIKFSPANGGRYMVMSPRRNPLNKRTARARTQKLRRVPASPRNPGELVVLGLGNPKRTGLKKFIVRVRREGKVHTWERFAENLQSAKRSAREAISREWPDGKAKLASVRQTAKNVEFGEYEKGVFHPWTRRPYSRQKSARRKLGRRNSEPIDRAKALFKKFHGKDSGRVLDMQRSAKQRRDYASLGSLVAIGIDAPRFDELNPDPDKVVDQWDKLPHLKFAKDNTMLAAAPDGKQLYLLGGDQEIDVNAFDTDASKDFVDLGECTYIVYTARKAPSFEAVDWVHTFGEEGGTRPRLAYNRIAKELFFVGGSYRIEAPGIID